MTDDIVARLRRRSGEGCRCGAWYYGECACDNVHWGGPMDKEAADEIELLRGLSDSLAHHLEGYVCHCQMSKCKCGYDDVMDLYREIRG